MFIIYLVSIVNLRLIKISLIKYFKGLPWSQKFGSGKAALERYAKFYKKASQPVACTKSLSRCNCLKLIVIRD